ncbi:MAG: hypothetical protein ACOC8A_01275 [bacterium]
MTPRRTTELTVEFAAQASPWWLLLAVPAALAACWFLYRGQVRKLARGHAAALVGLRMLLVASLATLAFKPSVVRRETRIYPGRVVLLLDDSQSMLTRDNALTDAEALRVARGINGQDGSAPCFALGRLLGEVESRLLRFEAYARGADRAADAFWERAERAQDAVAGGLDQVVEGLLATPLPKPELDREMTAARAESRALRDEAGRFFAGERLPGEEAFDAFCTRLQALRSRLDALQAGADDAAIAKGDEALLARAQAVRDRPRIALLRAKLDAAQGIWNTLLPGQAYEFVRLVGGQRGPIEDLDPVAGVTDVGGRLHTLLGEENDYPLTAIVLFSDGLDHGGRDAVALHEELSRRQVPVYTAGVGCPRQPRDAAILGVAAPRFAVKGSPTRAHVSLKANVGSAARAVVELLQGGTAVASENVPLGADAEQDIALSFVPSETGLFRCTVRVSGLPGEAFPARNNAAEFALHVRDDTVKVLLLDWKPRWETRFVLNILRRLSYVELNAIIVLAQENAVLERGVGKGTWPEDRDALAMYDLVVLGDLPQGTLSSGEWGDLRSFVAERGGTVCFIGSGRRPPVPSALADALLPLAAHGGSENAPLLDGPARLRLTEAGAVHPVTRLLASGTVVAADGAAPGLLPNSYALCAGADGGAPLVAARFVDKGKVLLVNTDRLWAALNPTLLRAHGRMYVELVNWAVEGRLFPQARMPASVGLDARVFRTDHTVQVWVSGKSGANVQASADGEIVAEAEAASDGTPLARAVFRGLPGRDLAFGLADNSHVVSPPVVVIEDSPELKRLARDDAFLDRLASETGGASRDFVDFESLFATIKPKERVETDQSTWRLWDWWIVLTVLAAALSIEWVWRKLVGLV